MKFFKNIKGGQNLRNKFDNGFIEIHFSIQIIFLSIQSRLGHDRWFFPIL